MIDKKSIEEECLRIVKCIHSCPEIEVEYECCERPDFVFSNGTGVEHFLVDVNRKYKASIERMTQRSITSKVDYYKEHEDQLDRDIANESAARYIEDIVNNQYEGVSTFDYLGFAENFRRIYSSHLKSIGEYRKSCDKIGFLIEMPYIKPIGSHGYIITEDGKQRNQCLKTIPITRDMIHCFRMVNNVDFIILCIRPIFKDKHFYKNSQVIRIDMKNIEDSIRRQGMIICDKFDYSLKFTNRDVLHLKVEHTNREL